MSLFAVERSATTSDRLAVRRAFGISVTADHVSRAITNSGNQPAIQGYNEPSIGMAYLNIWPANVDFGLGFLKCGDRHGAWHPA